MKTANDTKPAHADVPKVSVPVQTTSSNSASRSDADLSATMQLSQNVRTVDWDVVFVLQNEASNTACNLEYLESFNTPGSLVMFPRSAENTSNLIALAQHMNLAYPANASDFKLSELITKYLRTSHAKKDRVVLAFDETGDGEANDLEQILLLAKLKNVRVVVFARADRAALGKTICAKLSLVASCTSPNRKEGQPQTVRNYDRANRVKLLAPLLIIILVAATITVSAIIYSRQTANPNKSSAADKSSTNKVSVQRKPASTGVAGSATTSPNVEKPALSVAISEPVQLNKRKIDASIEDISPEAQRTTHRIQLITLTDLTRVDEFIERHNGVGKLHIAENGMGTTSRYTISVGNYPSYKTAEAALSKLPPELGELQPFVARATNPNE